MAIKERYIPVSVDTKLPVTFGVEDQNYRQIDINLDAGFDLEELRSLHHNVDISQNFDN